MRNASFDHSVANNANFTGAVLTGADLSCASMEKANFTRADLRGVIVGNDYIEDILKGGNIFDVECAPYLVGAIFNETIMPDGSINNPSI